MLCGHGLVVDVINFLKKNMSFHPNIISHCMTCICIYIQLYSPRFVLQLVKSKCLPELCYGVDVCPVNKSQTASLQYVVDNCFRKIFDVKSTEIVRHCMSEFKWLTMCDMIDIKKRKFLEKFSISENSLCHVIVHMCNPR